MIVGAFICGPHGADDWILPHKLRVMSELCDRVTVLLDRSPESVGICERFPKVEVIHDASEELTDAHDGPRWDEGRLRQRVWDHATREHPQYVLLGDTDEIPAPSIKGHIQSCDTGTGYWYSHWPNLIYDTSRVIGGDSVWSYERSDTNKKGVLIRYDRKREYKYRDGKRHVRLEPSPRDECKAVLGSGHRLMRCVLVHYRWANWERWVKSDMSGLPAYQPWPPVDTTIRKSRPEWFWRWDADRYLATLPEPIAVVGNGPMMFKADRIDAHASVIRMNNWRTAGYEKHVGRKATCWYTNCFDNIERRAWPGDMITGYTDDEQPERLACWLGMYPHMHPPNVSWFDDARKLKAHPSHGLTLLWRLIHHGKRVTAFGFDGMKSGHYWNPTHAHNHGGDEADVLAMLATKGVVFA